MMIRLTICLLLVSSAMAAEQDTLPIPAELTLTSSPEGMKLEINWEEVRKRPEDWPDWMMERPGSQPRSDETTSPVVGFGCLQCGHVCRVYDPIISRILNSDPPISEYDQHCEHGHSWVKWDRGGEVGYR